MSKILVDESDRASEAILWCIRTFDKGEWTVETQWPGSGYIFSFNRDPDAGLFGLRWAN
jgi:hypothetical protein